MKSNLAFLAATIAAGCSLVFSAANAQVLPTVLHFVWLESTELIYDPLLVATFILAATLAVGRSIDILRDVRHGNEAPRPKQHQLEPSPRREQAGAGSAPPKQGLNLGSV
ncbi:MAG: hypothetical protein OEU25_10655 [Rhodospirillales bacterium]|nr:hypothetical protein [Rhodospirillales bacterium]